MKVGIRVYCTICGRSKAPHGRSAPDALYGSLCNTECDGYEVDPKPGCLWPGETDSDFGFPCCDEATTPVSA